MNGYKRIVSLGLAIGLAATTLTGCGGSSKSDYFAGEAIDDGVTGSMNWDTTSGMSVDGFSSSNNTFQSTTESVVMMPTDNGESGWLDESYDIEYETSEYDTIKENRFLSVQNNPLSTFAADVDTASYSNIRSYLNRGGMPPEDAVKIEEMVNYFKYNYKEPGKDEPFSCTTEVVQCPWNKDTLLLSIGLATESIDTSRMPAQNLVFLIDVSGSMEGSDRLGLVKRSFQLLCEQLNPNDTVSIVTYASGDKIVIDGARGDEIDLIMTAIEELDAGGSTNGSDGIITAYKLAKKHFIEGGNNRVILATDGDLNVGVTSEGELTDLIEEKREDGIFLSVLGFGYGNYKDNKLEALADNGNGNMAYIDSIIEARKALIDDMGGTLITVAKDAKLQVEFNPNTVKGYRLIGYENRLLAAEDFADDTVDGGEVGAGHRVTALYEIVPIDSAMEIDGIDLKYQNTDSNNGSDELCTVSVRCKSPTGVNSKLWEFIVDNNVNDEMSDNLRLASAVAQFGMLLRDSEYSGEATYESVIEQLKQLEYTDALVDELIYLVRKASKLS